MSAERFRIDTLADALAVLKAYCIAIYGSAK